MTGSLAELAHRFGTPLYVYDLADVRAAHAALRDVLPVGCSLYYSLKANPHPHVARQLRELECRAEVCSPGELGAAAAAGWDGLDVLYTGPGKTSDEIELAIARGVRRFSVESETDAARVADAARSATSDVRLLVRVNPGSSAAAGVSMTGASQFGVDGTTLLERGFTIPAGPAIVDGFHVFSGSNHAGVEEIVSAASVAANAVLAAADALGVDPVVVDLGGGFGHPYGRSGGRPDLACARAGLEAVLQSAFPRRTGVDVCFESGRFLVGGAGTFVVSVEDVKVSKGLRFVVADGGINHLGGMGALGRIPRAGFELTVVDAEACATTGGPAATVVGPLCSPLDVLARGRTSGHIARGDLLAVPNVGAYGLTASLLGFLGRACPVEVVVDGENVVSATRLELTRSELAAR